MIGQEIKNYLDTNHIPYQTIHHLPAYTASQTAQAAHISGKHLAKVVIVKLDGNFAMVALPANRNVDWEALKKVTNAKQVELASEQEFSQLFPNCDTGAMPPFGNLYGCDVYLADSLAHETWFAFNGGSHDDLIRMSTKDFLKEVNPTLLPQC
jgi:Ala-tRNA(Pro) deacylase